MEMCLLDRSTKKSVSTGIFLLRQLEMCPVSEKNCLLMSKARFCWFSYSLVSVHKYSCKKNDFFGSNKNSQIYLLEQFANKPIPRSVDTIVYFFQVISLCGLSNLLFDSRKKVILFNFLILLEKPDI